MDVNILLRLDIFLGGKYSTENLTSVSYTHLDVYKRQVPTLNPLLPSRKLLIVSSNYILKIERDIKKSGLTPFASLISLAFFS